MQRPQEKQLVEVHWVTTPDKLTSGQEKTLRQILSAEEWHKGTRYQFTTDRVQFWIVHAIIRLLLTQKEKKSPQEWQFTSKGRPELLPEHNPEHYRFNLTHTRGLVGCVLTRQAACGIDGETWRTLHQFPGLVAKCLHPSERSIVLSAPHPERKFIRFWTLKEAFLKAKGIGLAAPLDAIAFTLGEASAPNPTIALNSSYENEATPWHFTQFSPTANHLLSLAIASERPCEFQNHPWECKKLFNEIEEALGDA